MSTLKPSAVPAGTVKVDQLFQSGKLFDRHLVYYQTEMSTLIHAASPADTAKVDHSVQKNSLPIIEAVDTYRVDH